MNCAVPAYQVLEPPETGTGSEGVSVVPLRGNSFFSQELLRFMLSVFSQPLAR